MLDQLAIVRKHALLVWQHPRETPRQTLGAIHAAAAVAYDEIESTIPKSPLVLILTIVQIIYMIGWLISVVWPRRPPQEDAEDELEQMLAQLSA
jgi:hypothetical protein